MSNAANTATSEARYALVATENAESGLTLYEARKALQAAAKAGLLTDATHIRRGDRTVAFYCEWHHEVRAMFGAHPQERSALTDWA